MAKKVTPLSKRLQELEEQQALIDQDIRALNKALRKPGASDIPELKSRTLVPDRAPDPAASKPIALTPADQPPPAAPVPSASPAQAQAPAAGEARATLARLLGGGSARKPEPAATPVAVAEPVEQELNLGLPGQAPTAPGAHNWAPQQQPRIRTIPEARKAQVKDSGRFANYFASGSFGRNRPMAQEKKVQRNKAVFMLIFVLLFGSILVKLIF